MRLVLDTNVVIAGLLWHGTPRRLLDRAIDDDTVELYSSPALIDELGNTLKYPKFAQRNLQARPEASSALRNDTRKFSLMR